MLITIVLVISYVLFFTEILKTTPIVNIIEKDNIIETERFVLYENTTSINLEEIFNFNLNLVTEDIVEELQTNRDYFRYRRDNTMGIDLLNYLIEKSIDITDIEKQFIIRISDYKDLTSNLITDLSSFEIPVNYTRPDIDDVNINNEYSVKFNIEKSTITLKERESSLGNWNIIYSGYIPLDNLIGSYIIDTQYYFSESLDTGNIIVKKIDNEGVIGYHMFSLGYSDDGYIQIISNNNELLSNQLDKRENCNREIVVKEFLEINNEYISLHCINNDGIISVDNLSF